MAKPQGQRQVSCYHCGHPFMVGGRAMSTPCPKCNRPVLIEDVVVKGYKGVISVETCGKLIVKRLGRVVAQQRIVAHQGIEVEGTVECRQVFSGGTVRIGPKGVWKGDLKAAALEVREGARIRASHFMIPYLPEKPQRRPQDPAPDAR